MQSSKFAEARSVFRVLAAIRSFHGGWFTVEEIAQRLGMAQRTLRGYLKYLVEEEQLLERQIAAQDGPGGQPYRYRHVPRYPLFEALQRENDALRARVKRLECLIYSEREDYSA